MNGLKQIIMSRLCLNKINKSCKVRKTDACSLENEAFFLNKYCSNSGTFRVKIFLLRCNTVSLNALGTNVINSTFV